MSDTIKYSITFYSQWHCGSGLSAGADVDALVVKDRNNMPFVPGKTLKGLIREAVENLVQFEGKATKMNDLINETFGKESEATKDDKGVSGSAHFSNAELCDNEYKAIVANNVSTFLYNKVTTTAIGVDGTAQEHSLRSTEVVIPCTLHAEITGVPEAMKDTIIRSFGLIKRLGQKRTRGLGRCDVRVEEGGNV